MPVVGGVAGLHAAVVNNKRLLPESKDPVRRVEILQGKKTLEL